MLLPLVSVIVNVCNGERYVGQCLDSVLALQGHYPLQVIVVDDASTDATADVLGRYADPRITVVAIQRNVGAAAAINHAFGLVRGELVGRIDYDDRYHPFWLVRSVAALEAHPDAAFVCANAIMIDAQGTPGALTGPFQYGEAPGSFDRFRSMLTRHFVTAPTILARTRHWRRAMPVPAGMTSATGT